MPAGSTRRNIATRFAFGFTTTGLRAPAAAAGRRCCRCRRRPPAGYSRPLAQHGHLHRVVAVAERAERREFRPRPGADHRHVLDGRRGQDRARASSGGAPGGDDDAVASFRMLQQDIQASGNKRLDRLRMGFDIAVDQCIGSRRRWIPMVPIHTNTEIPARRVGSQPPSARRQAPRGSPATRHQARSSNHLNKWLPGLAVVQGVVGVEHHQRRIDARPW